MCIYFVNVQVQLYKGPAKVLQGGPKVLIDTSLSMSTYDQQKTAMRCCDASSIDAHCNYHCKGNLCKRKILIPKQRLPPVANNWADWASLVVRRCNLCQLHGALLSKRGEWKFTPRSNMTLGCYITIFRHTNLFKQMNTLNPIHI